MFNRLEQRVHPTVYPQRTTYHGKKWIAHRRPSRLTFEHFHDSNRDRRSNRHARTIEPKIIRDRGGARKRRSSFSAEGFSCRKCGSKTAGRAEGKTSGRTAFDRGLRRLRRRAGNPGLRHGQIFALVPVDEGVVARDQLAEGGEVSQYFLLPVRSPLDCRPGACCAG